MYSEDELCLLLAQSRLLPEVQARVIELLSGAIQWDAFLRRAQEHNVTPLIYRTLTGLGFPGVPEGVQDEIITLFRSNALRNLYLVGELARVLRLLGDAGVRVLPLKGVALAQSLYGDPALRICSDLDILVPPGDALTARRILLANGYTSLFSEEFFLKHQFHTSADCSLIPQAESHRFLLELHWTLFQHSIKDAEAARDLWAQAHPEDYFGVTASGLTPEWSFVYLAAHVASHKWQALRWIADIHDLCATTNIDWARVCRMAEQYDLEFIVSSTLAICASLYGTPIPVNFSPVTLPPGVRLFPHSLEASETWKSPLYYPNLLKRPSEKLRWFAEMFFVARLADRRTFNLPNSLSFLYFVLRPMRLALKWSRLFLAEGFRRLKGAGRERRSAEGGK